MTEFTIRLADERGRIQEQTHAAATAEELRARFTQAGYLRLLRQAAHRPCRRIEAQGQAGAVSRLQPAVPDAHSRRPAHSRLAGTAGQAPEKPQSSAPSLRTSPPASRLANPSLRPSRRRAASRWSTRSRFSPASAPATSKRSCSATSISSASRSPSARS